MPGKTPQVSTNGAQQSPGHLREAPSALSPAPLRRVAFHAVALESQQILKAPPRRDRVDKALLVAEGFIAAIVIAFTLWRVGDGPVRDWMHERTAAAAPHVPASQSARQPDPVATARQPDKKLSPTSAPIKQPAKVATATNVPAERPNLGAALPSSPRQTLRPVTTVDYLLPARRFVPALPPAPELTATPPGEPAALDLRPVRLEAPGAGIDAPVVEVFLEDGAWQVADYAVGYHHGTGLPGDGNIVMAGHKGVRGAVFAQLERLKVGADVFVDAAGQRFHYRVRTTGNVWPSNVAIMYPTPLPTLTLLTCTNWDTQRFVVIADLVDSAKLPPSTGG